MGHEILSSAGYEEEATHGQTMQFTRKLDGVFDRRGGEFRCGNMSTSAVSNLRQDTTVEVGLFREANEDSVDRIYTVGLSVVRAATKEAWNEDGFAMARSKEEGMAFWVVDEDDEPHDVLDIFLDDEETSVGEYIQDLSPEFYLGEHSSIRFYVEGRTVSFCKEVTFELYDEEQNAINCEVASHRATKGFIDEDAETYDLENLLKFQEKMLDTEAAEESLSVVTAADLIATCSVLRKMRILDPRVKAYRGAPMDITGLNWFLAE